MCNKRSYPSRRAVRLAHCSGSFTLFAYYCKDCHGWHAASRGKRRPASLRQRTLDRLARVSSEDMETDSADLSDPIYV